MSVSPPQNRLPAEAGLLAHLIAHRFPRLRKHIQANHRIETAVYGLGEQGKRHAALMSASGTPVVAAVAQGFKMPFVHESIPVYETVAEMVHAHSRVAAISIWKHFTSAAQAATEAIDAGIPVVVLISEGVPVQDAQRLRALAHEKGVLLFGPNTPGVIFPPESLKIGMLPDVFQAAEDERGRIAGNGVTIISRSGAILYHMSDALAAAGIAQNGVLGIGGDAVVGTDFLELVPLVMQHPHTDAVVIAGEIGGAKEEILARDIEANPKRYPKPLIALLSGRNAPVGKTMGHAGALISPGASYGSYAGKKHALEHAGIVVVNGQTALVTAVRKAIGGRTYFAPERYRMKMRNLWETAPPAPTWTTHLTDIAPNKIAVRGCSIQDLIGHTTLLGAASLLVGGKVPGKPKLRELDALACVAARRTAPVVPRHESQTLAQYLAASLLADGAFADYEGTGEELAAFSLGRVVRYMAAFSGAKLPRKNAAFSELASAALAQCVSSPVRASIFDAMLVASVDHGVTPPSAQATILAASVRAPFAACLASGLIAITDVHGGAGASAVKFFLACSSRARMRHISPQRAAEETIREYAAHGHRVEGLGHRVHTHDPRRDVLWKLAKRLKIAGEHVAVSETLEDAFENVHGIRIPINVDGVIGAIIADMGLPPQTAAALFLLGRTAGLAAHYFEELATQPPMRQINFAQAVYRP